VGSLATFVVGINDESNCDGENGLSVGTKLVESNVGVVLDSRRIGSDDGAIEGFETGR